MLLAWSAFAVGSWHLQRPGGTSRQTYRLFLLLNYGIYFILLPWTAFRNEARFGELLSVFVQTGNKGKAPSVEHWDFTMVKSHRGSQLPTRNVTTRLLRICISHRPIDPLEQKVESLHFTAECHTVSKDSPNSHIHNSRWKLHECENNRDHDIIPVVSQSYIMAFF